MAEPFNIERFMETSARVDLSDIDWADVPRHPLTPEALRVLRYFMITESSTFFYARVLMQTASVLEEPELAPFLAVWTYEEEYHGRAFRRFVEATGEPVDPAYRTNLFRNRTVGEKVDEVGQIVIAKLFPEAWPAVHMIWGAVQELTTYSAYQSLVDRIDHPVLNVICQRIMKQELKHFAFYYQQARKRLAASKRTQVVVSNALRVGWTPVGDGMSPTSEAVHAIRFLFDGRDGQAIPHVERRIRELPGLEWFDLFTKFAVKHDIRAAPREWLPAERKGANGAARRVVELPTA
jgi:hypothetical protein